MSLKKMSSQLPGPNSRKKGYREYSSMENRLSGNHLSLHPCSGHHGGSNTSSHDALRHKLATSFTKAKVLPPLSILNSEGVWREKRRSPGIHMYILKVKE